MAVKCCNLTSPQHSLTFIIKKLMFHYKRHVVKVYIDFVPAYLQKKFFTATSITAYILATQLNVYYYTSHSTICRITLRHAGSIANIKK